jgi:cytochrome c
MDSFELNKIMGAVLGCCLVLLSLNITAGAIFAPHAPAKPGYDIAVKEAEPAGKPGTPAPPEEPIATFLAKADIARGEVSAKKCAACHTFGKGEPNRVGPNLWGIVGRPIASVPGFNYSAAMKGKGGNWTIEHLNTYLLNPRADIPGTNMNFAGIPRPTERADLLSFLNSKADNPAPLPKAADAGAAAKPAAGDAPKPAAGDAPKPAGEAPKKP